MRTTLSTWAQRGYGRNEDMGATRIWAQRGQLIVTVTIYPIVLLAQISE
jgi:hypothetical protein